MKRDEEEKDALWETLGQAPEHRASPFFVRNVLREVRRTEETSPSWAGWFGNWRVAGPAALAVVAVCAGLLVRSPSTQPEVVQAALAEPAVASAPTVARIEADPDYEVIAELDTLLAYENNNQWLDSSVSN